MKTKTKKTGFSPILVLLLVVLAVIGYFAYKALHTSLSTVQIPIVDTSNWKTFNSDFGYSMKYPSDWTISTSEQGGTAKIDPSIDFEPIFSSPCGDLCSEIQIQSVPYNSTGTIQAGMPSVDVNNKLSPDFEVEKGEKILDKVNTKLDTEAAVGFEYFSPSYFQEYVVVSDHDSTRYTITYQEGGKKIDQAQYIAGKNFAGTSPAAWKNKQILDAMLSTFKFTNSQVNEDTNGLKIYTNTKYGFRFDFDPTSFISENLDTGGRLLVNVSNNKFTKNNYLDDVAYFKLEVSGRSCNEWMNGEKSTPRIIGGENVAYFEGTVAYGNYQRSACLTKGDTSYFFVQDIVYPEHSLEAGNMFNQILSSFTFTK
jgi:hypothetical protein